uniref:Uncharacterized protein n=1 Tax=Setaria viridis TaxID=4556 RepID=A0A4U6VZP1_SETVI|nr:hypothetical protein SEVIR_2G044333v2 [Setaria viridis]
MTALSSPGAAGATAFVVATHGTHCTSAVYSDSLSTVGGASGGSSATGPFISSASPPWLSPS